MRKLRRDLKTTFAVLVCSCAGADITADVVGGVDGVVGVLRRDRRYEESRTQ